MSVEMILSIIDRFETIIFLNQLITLLISFNNNTSHYSHDNTSKTLKKVKTVIFQSVEQFE